jgi:hypothetical protein
MGVTVTHPLPPLKRGGLSGEAQFLKIPTVISKSFKKFSSDKNRPYPNTARLADAPPLLRGGRGVCYGNAHAIPHPCSLRFGVAALLRRG